MNTWIKTSECAPTKADFPIEVADVKDHSTPYAIVTQGEISPDCWTHWRKIAPSDIPAPPREETQAEKEAMAFRQYCEQKQGALYHSETWYAALEWERSQVAGMLPDMQTAPWYTLKQAIGAIRVRCEGRGQ